MILPLSDGFSQTLPQVEEMMEGDASSRRIIVVEDNADLRETLGRALVREGYQVNLASDGAEALCLIRERPYDLAIIDLVMPRMDGLTMLQELRGLGLPLPTIVITAYGDRFSYNRATELGASEYLVKPVKLVELYRAVRKVLAGG